jgi:acyl dehydratase
MSKRSLRLGIVAEGITDFELLKRLVALLLPGQDHVVQLIQPEYSETFQMIPGAIVSGWAGVYRWCRQTADEGRTVVEEILEAAMRRGEVVTPGAGGARNSYVFVTYDLVIIHIDADVAGKTYHDGGIVEAVEDLPCERPCPHPSATTDALRLVLLRWLGETVHPPKVVFCTPSKSTEAWVMMAFFPENEEMRGPGWECYADPEAQLARQPLERRLHKTREEYRRVAHAFAEEWPRICQELSEAKRFSQEFQAAVPPI